MSIGWMSTLLTVFTWAVVFGVVLEGTEHVREYFPREWLKSLEKFGFAILVVGLAGEWYFQSKISQYQEDIITGQQREIIALEERIAPRMLTAEEYAAIRTLRGKVQAVYVIASPDSEPAMFSAQLQEALYEAGITVIPVPNTSETRWVGTQICLPDNESAKENPLWRVFVTIGLKPAPCSLEDVALSIPKGVPLIIVGERQPFFPSGAPKSPRFRIYPGLAPKPQPEAHSK